MTIRPGQHRLNRIQLVDWGTFDRYVDLPVPRSGLLITGESGSGKSSLLDAMAAVLVRPGKLTLNAAAQETGAGDRARSLLTYVRGAHKREADADSGEVVTAYLRPGAAWSGIALTFDDGRGHATSLIRLLHAATSATAAKDVHSLFILAEQPVDLLELRGYAENGLDQRRLKAAWPAWSVNSDYSGFAQRLQRRFGLESDQAQLLLHKTQSAKNLTSLDHLLRDFMLDPPETFELADQAVEQFDQLSAAHRSVVDARQQVDSLAELDAHAERRAGLLAEAEAVRAEQAHVEAYRLERTVADADAALDRLATRLAALAREVAQAEAALSDRRAEQSTAQRLVDGLGGQQLEFLTKEQALLARQLERVQAERAGLAAHAASAHVELPAGADGVEPFRQRVVALADGLAETAADREARYGLAAAAAQARQAREQVERQLRTLKNRRSPLDEGLLALRSALAEAAGVDVARLAFAGELLQLRADDRDWTGAAERVLRPLATTLLVPDDLYPLVSDHVDRHHLGLRLVYVRVPAPVEAAAAPRDRRSLAHKVEVGASEFAAWLRAELARRYDYACVETAAELRAVERGVTRAGQVKHSATRHEKDDRSRVDDPSRWVLGSSAAPKKAALQAELERLRAEAEAAERARDARDDEQTARQDMLRHLDALRRLDWAAIDQDGARRDLDRVEAQLALLLDAQGELARAQARLERAAAAVADAEGALEKLRDRRSRTSADQEREQARRDAAAGELAALEPVPAAVAAALAARFAATGLGLDQAGRRVRDELAGHALRVDRRVAGVEQKCVVAMSQYKAAWPGPAADLAADIDYLAEFRQILATLRSDRLPEFETRFFDLLQSQSRNNIGLIAKTITSSRRDIRLRVNPINQSLRQTDYAPGRHLSLRVIDAPPPGVVEFLQTLNAIVAGSLDDAAGIEATPAARQLAEERFQSLERLLRRLASPDPADQNWRKLCLDTRQHVKFRADVVDSATDVVDDVYVSAGGLSGGERQKLVVFCLAAALRYQLAREGSAQPSYGLVVLDEAFDKTDPAFTKAGLDVFQAFGFQLVLATPLKMLQTLEDYVGGAVQVVNREGEGSSCETLIWEPAGDAPAAVPVPPEQESLL